MNISKRQLINLIISGILAFGVYFVIIRPIVATMKYHYTAIFDDYRHYAWILNDTVEFDTLFSGIGQVRKTDNHYSYLIKDRVFIEIFEYTDLNNIKLNEINFGIQRKFPLFKNIEGTVLNSELGKEAPVISIKDELPFRNTLNVSFNKNAPLTLIRDSLNCRAYFGSLNKMLLSNANNDPLVLFDFSKV